MRRLRHQRAHPHSAVTGPAVAVTTESRPVAQSPSFLQQCIVWLFHLVVVTTPLFFAFSTDELFEFNKMILTYVYAVLIVAAWMMRMVFEKRLISRHTKMDYLIGAFLLSQLLSTVFSIHPYTSLLGYYSRFHGGFVSLLTYAVLYWAFVSNVLRKDLRPLALSTMVAGGLVSLYAIGEHFGHSVSCYLTSGGTSFGVDCWVQDVQHRVFATFGQPNWLAAYVLMLLSACVGILMGRWATTWERWSYYSCYLLLFWTLLYTRSRSGFLGFLAALAVIGGGILVKRWLSARTIKQGGLEKSDGTLRTVGILAGLTVFAMAVSGTPYSPSVADLLAKSRSASSGTTSSTSSSSGAQTGEAPAPSATPAPVVANRLDIGGTDSGEIRKIVWQGAFDVWRRYPVFGSGVETFAYSYYQDRPTAHNLVSEWDFLYNKAHNEFLNFLATTGAVGLLAYLALLVGYGLIALQGFVTLVKAHKLDRAYVVLSLLAAVVGLSVSNFFGFSTVVVTVLQYLAFAITVILIYPQVVLPPAPKTLSAAQITLLILVTVLALFPLKRIMDYYRADILYTSAKGLMGAGEVKSAAVALTEAIRLSPGEALFWDELSQLYGQAAVTYAEAKIPDINIDGLVREAISSSDQAMKLNDRQLNLYKTRARLFILLSQLDPQYLTEAVATLERASQLSPTDPKLLYNLAIIKFEQGDTAQGTALLRRAVELKPNYGQALNELARREWAAGQQAEAVAHLEQLLVYDPNSAALQELLASYSAQLEKKK